MSASSQEPAYAVPDGQSVLVRRFHGATQHETIHLRTVDGDAGGEHVATDPTERAAALADTEHAEPALHERTDALVAELHAAVAAARERQAQRDWIEGRSPGSTRSVPRWPTAGT